jgi:hypothetical protein
MMHGNQTEQEIVTLGEVLKCRGCGNQTEHIQHDSSVNHDSVVLEARVTTIKEFCNFINYVYSITLMLTLLSFLHRTYFY